ncbi:MAG TPA: 30S ribosomal protein S8 [bacterium]|nr:30S ribosomal protein S8 [bacterium]
MNTDPIADMLTRIRNGQKVRKPEVVLPFSNFKFNIAKVLAQNNWLGQVETVEPIIDKKKKNNSQFKQIKIELLYQNKQAKITAINRVSKPGRRIYVTHENLPIVRNNYGLAIISTPQGILSNKEAKKLGLGGEVICEVY